MGLIFNMGRKRTNKSKKNYQDVTNRAKLSDNQEIRQRLLEVYGNHANNIMSRPDIFGMSPNHA